MTDNLPQKNVIDDVAAALLSYSDPNLITAVLRQMGWSPNQEIIETLYVSRQNVNLGAKMTALKHLRALLHVAAEANGLIVTATKTFNDEDGSHTTFSAKGMMKALNPKPVESKEIQNDRTERKTEEHPGSIGSEGGGRPAGTDSGRDCDRSPDERGPGDETGDAVSGCPSADQTSGGQCESEIGEGNRLLGEFTGADFDSIGEDDIDRIEFDKNPDAGNSPCIEHQSPTCSQELYPGVSGKGPESNEQERRP